jgi:ABC-type dipeptide/oligopeptide/nickel transport system permease subunit
MGHSRLALGIAIGVALAVVGGPAVKSLAAMEHMRLWLPVLPFALIAVTLFFFGLLAWFWADD